jgi:hypothetical protein
MAATQTKQKEQTETSVPEEKSASQPGNQVVYVKREPDRELYKWTAASRPFKRRDRDFWVTLISIATIIGLIMFLIEGPMPVILIIAIIFLFYVLSTVEPENIEYKVTSRGIKIADRNTHWDLLTRFWFTDRFNSEILVFEMVVLPGRLELVINPSDKENLRKVLSEYLIEEEAPPSNLDKAANWFSNKFPA